MPSSSTSSSYPRPSVGSTPRMSQGIGRASRVSIGNQPQAQAPTHSGSSSQTPKFNLPPLSSTNFTPRESSRHYSRPVSRPSIMLSSRHQGGNGDVDDNGDGDGGIDPDQSSNQSTHADLLFTQAPPSNLLPPGRDFNPPSLQFQVSNQALESFMENFTLAIREKISHCKNQKDEFEDGKVQRQLKMRKLINAKKEAEEELDNQWQAIKQEQESESLKRQKLSGLNSNHTSLRERCGEVQLEIKESNQNLKEKEKEKEIEKSKLKNQKDRNDPELQSLMELTGCRISGTKKLDETRFIFSLINSEDYSETSSLTLDHSSKTYRISSHSKHLKESKLEELIDFLNKSRDLYAFLKKVREALRREFDERRAARRAAV